MVGRAGDGADDPLAWIDSESADWAALGLSRSLRRTSVDLFNRRVWRGGRALVNFASNDYLGLAHDPRVVGSATLTARSVGWGAGASPLVSGWTVDHDDLARLLAEFEGTEAAVVFPTGYAAILGTIAALVGRPDAVYSDRLNHASLIDGCRLSGATIRIYAHADADALAVLLREDDGRFRRRLIATDGVFSMDGDLAPLDRLADLAERHGAMFLVDEAHGTGVFGPDGRGAAAEFGVEGRATAKVGTLSKALASLGGFVAGSRRLIDWLTNHARPLIFSTAAPAAACAAAITALAISRAEPWRRERARAIGDRLRGELRASGFDVSASTGPIVPVQVGDPSAAVDLADRLEARGFLVPAIRPPTVPDGTSRLRVVASASHSDADVDALILAFREARP